MNASQKRKADAERKAAEQKQKREEYLRSAGKIPGFLKSYTSVYDAPDSDAIHEACIPNPMARVAPEGQHWLAHYLNDAFRNRW